MSVQNTHTHDAPGQESQLESTGSICMSPPTLQLFASGASDPGGSPGEGAGEAQSDTVFQLASDCGALQERAAADAAEGSTLLQEALNDSFGTSFPFSFDEGLNGQTDINVREGATVTVRIRSTINGENREEHTFNYALTNRSGNREVNRFRTIPTGATRIAVFENVPAGTYYLRFRRLEGVEGTSAGNVWITIEEGPGLAAPDNDEGRRENELGIDPEGLDVQGRLVGEYSLRSTPARQSYILGTLLGDAVNVRLLDKRSYAEDGSDDWYLVKFRSAEEYATFAPCPPDAEFAEALAMYNRQEAWVGGKAVKGFIPFARFMEFVRAFESSEEISSLSLKDRVTQLRRFYSEKELNADGVIGTGSGSRGDYVDDRPSVSGLYQMLKLAMTGVVLPNGEQVDAGHIFLTIDAYNYPDKDASVLGQDVGRSRAASSWSGDVGAAAGDFLADHLEGGGGAFEQELIDWHYEKSAPFDDLMGNLDGLGMQLLTQQEGASFASVYQLINSYYGIGSSDSAGTLRNNRKLAIESFLSSYGFTRTSGLAGQSAAYENMLEETIPLARTWYIRSLGFGGRLSEIARGTQNDNIALVSRIMLNKFLSDFEGYARAAGATLGSGGGNE